MKIVAVTACPTGIAHTYMAAEMLETTAKKMHVEIKVETNGALGVEHELTPEDIRSADAVIIASDIFIEMDRFIGKPLLEVSPREAISHAEKLLNEAIAGKYQVYKRS